MHIELELDDRLAQSLLNSQKNANQNLTDVIKDILIQAVQEAKPQVVSDGKKMLRILEQHQLLGCMEGNGKLSVDYKNHLWND